MKHLTLLFLVRENQVLLAMKKRGFGAGRWNGVGGKVEENETVKEALVRECQEEIFVTPLHFEKVADITFDEKHFGVRDIHHAEVFIGTKWQGEPKESDEMAPQWFEQDNIPYGEMWPDDIYWLAKILAGKKVVGTFHLDDKDEVRDYHLHEVEAFDD